MMNTRKAVVAKPLHVWASRPGMLRHRLRGGLLMLACIGLALYAWSAGARADESAANLKAQGCGSLENPYGPFNYNTARGRKHWPIVRNYHFTQEVRTLKHGSTGSLGHDLDYTLRAFPNQPAALYDMIVYQLRDGYPNGGTHETVGYYSAECYLKRAVVFAPHDGVVRMIYAIYWQRKGDDQKALKRYKQAEKRIKPARSAELYYNMGLLYFQLKDYNNAREYAKKAYKRGYPLSGLRQQLKSVHQWSEPSSGPSSSG